MEFYTFEIENLIARGTCYKMHQRRIEIISMNKSELTYYPSKRHHTVPWLVFHAKDLREKSIRLKDVSKVLYACFELRNALELFEVTVLLSSVPEIYRQELLEISKNKNGIEKANKEFDGLKYKFQKFN